MENNFNSNLNKQTIYEIYRACRLCGAGAGYKMPIIQNVVDLDANGIELKQKIRDCVQIEVNSDDKMPPLICELCVDKVHELFEFQQLCQQTNRRTRARLGLPQTTGKVRNDLSDSGDCILGVTEQVYGNEDSDEPLATSRRPKAEPKVKIKVEKVENPKARADNKTRSQNSLHSKKAQEDPKRRDTRSRPDNSKDSRSRPDNSKESRSRPDNSKESRSRRRDSTESSASSLSESPRVTRQKRPPTPPRVTRNKRTASEESVTLSSLKQQAKKSKPPLQPPKSILKKDAKKPEELKGKRTRDPPRPELPQKKVKLSVPASPSVYACFVCGKEMATSQALASHQRSHVVAYTPPRLACDPCEAWFATADEAAAHHRGHRQRPYRCRRCGTKFKQLQAYDDHIANKLCLPWEEVPDEKCPKCWKLFPTRPLLERHRCGGPDSRPGGKCSKCRRTYALLKNLKKHEDTCAAQRNVEPRVRADGVSSTEWGRLRAARVRVSRCDSLLRGCGSCDVARVDQRFGLDPRCSYPYLEIPRLRCDRMVDIKAEPGDLASDHEDTNTVESLMTLALKTIFPNKHLGKSRKRGRVKSERNAFDSTFNDMDDMQLDIDQIIDNLEKTGFNDNDSVNSESLLCDGGPKVDDDDDSQSLIAGVGDALTTGVDNGTVSSVVSNVDESKLDRDGGSTDCETEAEDDVKNTQVNTNCRLSSDNDVDGGRSVENNDNVNNDIFDKVDRDSDVDKSDDIDVNNDSFDKVVANSDVGKTDESNVNNEENNDCVRTDGQVNGEFDELCQDEDLKEINNDKLGATDEPRADNDEQINESMLSDEKITENHDSEITVEDNNKGIVENNENMLNDERMTENNDRIDATNEHMTDNYEQINENMINDEGVAENNDKCIVNNDTLADNSETTVEIEKKLNDVEVRDSEIHHNDNEAMCNDIENKINDLIALNSRSDNWDDESGAQNDDDDVKKNCVGDDDETYTQDKEKVQVVNNEVVENNDEINDNFNQNDTEKEKIALEDLLPCKDGDTNSLGLDSISDEEFDFDA